MPLTLQFDVLIRLLLVFYITAIYLVFVFVGFLKIDVHF